MNILSINVMKGPNLWSIRRHKLIVMRLDLEEMENFPTNKIDGFSERLEAMFPTMYEHRCSENTSGGFFYRVKQGTWMGHVIEHIALEIQTLAGMDCGYGRTRETKISGIYNVVFSYMEEKVGIFAAKSAVRIAQALISGSDYDMESDIQEMREIREDERLGPSTSSLVDEAVARDIPYIRLNNHSLVQLGYGINQKRIQATIASTTGSIAVEIACDKEETKNLLEGMGVPVPNGKIVYTLKELDSALNRLEYPLVIKPVNGNHGKGATININNWEDLEIAFELAKKYSRAIIVEKYITGFDYRLLVINHQFVCAAKRTPASVVGDGVRTIKELVDNVNLDPRRGYGHEKVLTSIKIDDSTVAILEEKGYSIESVLKEGEIIWLKRTANLSTGGTAEDVTEIVHPFNVFMAERISKIIGLDICGIDIMSEDISEPLIDNGGAVLEVNAAPGFRMHISPTTGLPRNVAEPVIDMLYPPGVSSRIPIISVTGTNGKTTTTRLMAHIVKNMGYNVGFTTTDGIYIQNRLLQKGDCTGPISSEFVLRDPTVNFAVLETARGGILRAGLGFTKCDIAIVTNISGDHLGLKDINTVEDLARVKAVVPQTVVPNGYAILNADDDLVYGMRIGLDCNIALFSLDENNPRIVEHCNNGGIAAVVENGFVTICKGSWKLRVDKVINIPITYSGKAVFMIQNVLPAVIAAFVRNFKIEDIKIALSTFIPSPAQTPGRLNIFHFKNFQVMIDYAHNPAGFRAISKFMERIDAYPKVGLIAGVGDRRDEDIIELGVISAGMFDEIVIRSDRNLRGRSENEIINLLKAGIDSVSPNIKTTVIVTEREAIDHIITHAVKDSFICICSDVIPDALEQIMQYKEKEDRFNIS